MKRILVVLLAAFLALLVPLNASANDYGSVDIVLSSVVVADGEGYATLTWTLDGPVAGELRTAIYQREHPFESGEITDAEVDSYCTWLDQRLMDGFTIGLLKVTEINSNLTMSLVEGTASDDESEITMTVAFKCEDAGRDAKPLNALMYSMIWPSFMGGDANSAEITLHYFVGYVDTSGIAITGGQEEGTNLGFGVFQVMYYEATYENYAAMVADSEAASFTDQACCLCCTIFFMGAATVGSLGIVLLRRRK